MAYPTLTFPLTLTDLNAVPQRLFPALFTYLAGREDETDIERAYDGSEQTRARFDADAFPGCEFTTKRLDPRQAAGMKEFLESVRGRAEKFSFVEFDEQWFNSRLVGVTDGQDHLDINVHDAHGWTDSQVDGVTNTAFTYDVGGGTGGRDRINWTGTPPDTDLDVTFLQFWGRQVYIARLDSDKQVRVPFAGGQDTILGDGTEPSPRLYVKFQIVIRGTKE